VNTPQKSPLRHNLRAIHRPAGPPWRVWLHDVIFEADTFAGKLFDLVLLGVILISVGAIALETVPTISVDPGSMRILRGIELACTTFFGIEYVLRLICSRRPLSYVLSFWGVIDLLSFLPSLLTGFDAPSQRSFVILRSIRLLRVFRVLKLMRMISEADELSHAVWNSRDKIIVFLAVVLVAVTISGTLMYHVENRGESAADSQFSSIPQSMYWAIVTMTTVGYGDIVPKTTIGKFISAALILLGYSLIIVPSGFVSAEFGSIRRKREQAIAEVRRCPRCNEGGHLEDAIYCRRCSERL
jgi:voltage-gated potassium channel